MWLQLWVPPFMAAKGMLLPIWVIALSTNWPYNDDWSPLTGVPQFGALRSPQHEDNRDHTQETRISPEIKFICQTGSLKDCIEMTSFHVQNTCHRILQIPRCYIINKLVHRDHLICDLHLWYILTNFLGSLQLTWYNVFHCFVLNEWAHFIFA